ncbi:ABC transporter G family member 14 [Acipenser ruthenus]|uniref:Adenosine receptor A1 n=1 Tax=Acipenser ruthenus TaxID=7906 RepID=A0A444U0G5_ACIRT|nr:ABC transporter G family member 14 [Acipenser ruthenus]
MSSYQDSDSLPPRSKVGLAGFSNPGLELGEGECERAGMEDKMEGFHLDSTTGASAGQAESQKRRGLAVRFRGVEVEIQGRQILRDVAGTVLPGELLALMGPSGSGKTTLLSVLTGRIQAKSGQVTLGGRPLTKNLRRMLCYVMQQDIFFPNLTVKDTLMCQAHLRLPDSVTFAEKDKIISVLVEELGIKKCLNTIVGNDFVRGVSGGERKRVNIACELLTDPSVMLLDEPTSGLDSSTSHSLIATLKHYAVKHQKTIISSIHQPSSLIFHMFDKLLLMSDGEMCPLYNGDSPPVISASDLQVAYYGQASRIVDFFADLGMPCTAHENPADYMLDKVKESPEVRQDIVDYSNEFRISSVECPLLSKDETDPHLQSMAGELSEVKIAGTDGEGAGAELEEVESPQWASSFWMQLRTLTARNFKQQRPQILSLINVMKTLVTSIIPGLIWFQVPREEDQVKARAGMVLSELPLAIPQLLVHITISFWLTGLNGAGAYFADMGIIALSTFTAEALGLLISVVFLRIDQTMAFSTSVIVLTVLLGGFYIQKLPFWLVWLRYLAIILFSFHATLQLEFTDDTSFRCAIQSFSPHCAAAHLNNPNETAYIPAQEILDQFIIPLPVWGNILVLVLYRRVVTQKRAGVAVMVCWAVAFIVGFIPMLGWNNLEKINSTDLLVTCQFENVISMDYMVYFNFFGWVLPPLVLMLLIYTEIFCMIHKQLTKKVSASASDPSRYYNKELRLAKSLALVLFLFAVSWLPLHILNCVTLFCPSCKKPMVLTYIAIFLSHANSAVNPIIYAFRIKKFRTAFLTIWRQYFCCKKTPDLEDNLQNEKTDHQEVQNAV